MFYHNGAEYEGAFIRIPPPYNVQEGAEGAFIRIPPLIMFKKEHRGRSSESPLIMFKKEQRGRSSEFPPPYNVQEGT